MRRNLGWCKVRANMKLRLGTGTTTIVIQRNRYRQYSYSTTSHSIQQKQRQSASLNSTDQFMQTRCTQFLSRRTVSYVHLLPILALVPPADGNRMFIRHHFPETNNTHSSSYCEKCVIHYNTVQIESEVYI